MSVELLAAWLAFPKKAATWTSCGPSLGTKGARCISQLELSDAMLGNGGMPVNLLSMAAPDVMTP
eukprot:2402098-Pyramimonas_sp.AAC.1